MSITDQADSHAITDTNTTENAAQRPVRSVLLRDGCRDILPLSIGYLPMAFAIGGAVASLSIDRLAGWSGGPLISAGTAQLTLIEVLAAGGGVFAAVAAAIMINARLIAYSAALAPWFAHETKRWKLAIGFFTIDATYLLAAARFNNDDPGMRLRRWYFLGMGLTLYPLWSAGMAVGVIAGASVPDGLALEGAATFMMVGLLTMALNTRMVHLAAIAGGIVGLASGVMPGGWAPIVAAAAGVLVANVSTRLPWVITAKNVTQHEGETR
jgi:predicted branched-subunit amino acid permease